ncbi:MULTISPECIES: DinB family protein [unclassified Pseudactinotalea]|uniref:DinB family protein n=1 Tax=unclassified Pseudactinotalea TaxID=2649176 RepID=UPI00128C902D|nr:MULTISPECIES: DinB family protein [unclassified Pseudactinotalea]MPV50530.1 DinB family protein [Pseudactinotalea sp. HY160]QGH70672.1 DinB family protein [Pseudactinotalea sp. HY158]
MSADTPQHAQGPEVPVDTQDWTWVLSRTCPDCGLTSADFEPVQVADAATRIAAAFEGLLTSGSADLHRRPAPGVWSPIEYAAHVAEVCQVFDRRLGLILIRVDPEFPDWDQNRAAVDGGYGSRAPRAVAEELQHSAHALAVAIHAVPASEYERTGLRSDGTRFTVVTLLQYALHDLVHHWWDVSGQRAIR